MRADTFLAYWSTLLFSYYSLFKIYSRKLTKINPIIGITNKKEINNRVPNRDWLVNRKLKITTTTTPIIWPPKSKIPEEVASPTGKVVWVAKSVAVVMKGYATKPAHPPKI